MKLAHLMQMWVQGLIEQVKINSNECLHVFNLLGSEGTTISFLGKVNPRGDVVIAVCKSTTLNWIFVFSGELYHLKNSFVWILLTRLCIEPLTLPSTDYQQNNK